MPKINSGEEYISCSTQLSYHGWTGHPQVGFEPTTSSLQRIGTPYATEIERRGEKYW